MMMQGDTPDNAYTARSENWQRLKSLSAEERATWRVADVTDRPSADERGLPHEYMFGWYGVCLSNELATGQVKSVRYFGREMALWRGEDGEARLIDAYCAHYGANMAVGGVVNGNLLECPFHSWRWDGDGIAKDIPYARVIPPQARRKNCVPSYPVEESSGIIWMWYHPDRIDPLWELLTVKEYGDPAWTDYELYSWNIYTSLDHFADNAVDTAHFRYTHRTADMPSSKVTFDGWDRWSISHAPLGTPKGMINGTISIQSRGPGQSVTRFTWEGVAELILVAIVTPVDRDHVYMLQGIMQPKAQTEGPSARVGQALVREVTRQADEDKLILDRHKHVDPPLICDGDGPFGRNRVYHNLFLASKQRPTSPTSVAAE
jgi:3-ketosteroid 9alpha-monooxygenase subunit A